MSKSNKEQEPMSPVRGIENSKQTADNGEAARRAREHRFATTGEPSEAPGLDDVTAERAVTASKGSKSSKK